MKNSLASYFVLAIGFTIAGQAFAQELPSPQELITTANNLVDLRALEPYELTATFVLRFDADQKPGQIAISRDHEHYRFELRMSDYGESQFVLGDQRYIFRSRTYPPAGVLALSNLDRLLRIKLADDAKPGATLMRQVEGQPAYCFTIKRPKAGEEQLCFDAATRFPLSANLRYGYARNVFLGYKAVKDKVFPQQIKWSDERGVILEVQNLKITTVQPAPDTFKPPEAGPQLQSLQMATCDDIKVAEITTRTEPVYPQMARIAHITGFVHIYGIIGTDGRLHELHVQSGQPILAQASLDAVKNWEYKPALCGSTPVPTETELKIQFSIR